MSGKLLILEEFFKHKIWFLDFGPEVRLVGCSLKIEATGLLLILRGVSAEGPVVAFSQETELDGFRKRCLALGGKPALKWRADQYRLDSN